MIIFLSMHHAWMLHVLERTVCTPWLEDQWQVVAYVHRLLPPTSHTQPNPPNPTRLGTSGRTAGRTR
jgi:hypothetical protein